jgi:ATP-binding cassette subfamily B protein
MKRRAMSWAYYVAALQPLMIVLTGAATVMVLFIGGNDVVDGKMTIGQFVQFNTYLAVLSTRSCRWAGPSALQQGASAMKRVSRSSAPCPHRDLSIRPTLRTFAARWSSRRNLRYHERAILEDISLRIP